MRQLDAHKLDSIVESTREALSGQPLIAAEEALRQSVRRVLPANMSSKRQRQYADEARHVLIRQEIADAGGRFTLLVSYNRRVMEGLSEQAAIHELHSSITFHFVGPERLLAILMTTAQGLAEEARRGIPSEVPMHRRETTSVAVTMPTIATIGIVKVGVYYASLMPNRIWKPHADLNFGEQTRRHFGLACNAHEVRDAVDRFYYDAARHEDQNTIPEQEPDGSS